MLQEKRINEYAKKLVALEQSLENTTLDIDKEKIEKQITRLMDGFMVLTHCNISEACRLDEAVQKLLTK